MILFTILAMTNLELNVQFTKYTVPVIITVVYLGIMHFVAGFVDILKPQPRSRFTIVSPERLGQSTVEPKLKRVDGGSVLPYGGVDLEPGHTEFGRFSEENQELSGGSFSCGLD